MCRTVLLLGNKMAAWRASIHSNDEDTCSSCFDSTKYCCLYCKMSICNKCSVFEENESTCGWVAGKSVGYCEPCSKELKAKNDQSQSCIKPNVSNVQEQKRRTANPQSPEPNDADLESEESDYSVKDNGNSKSKKKQSKVGRRSKWSEGQLNDFIDIIVNNENYKKKLIFQNLKNQRNGIIYEQIIIELKQRCAEREENMPFGVEQLRSKFKKCVGECKRAALTIKTASGIKNFLEEKGFGAWFNQLYDIVKTRDSCKPDKAVEPSASSSRVDSDEDLFEQTQDYPESGTSIENEEKLFVPVKKSKRRKKEDPLSEAIHLMKSVIENDPTKDLIKFLRDDVEKSREHELKLFQMMLSAGSPQASPVQQNPSYAQPNSSGGYHQSCPPSMRPTNQQGYYPQEFALQQGHQEYQFRPVSPSTISRPISANSCYSSSSTSSVQHSRFSDTSDSPIYHSM